MSLFRSVLHRLFPALGEGGDRVPEDHFERLTWLLNHHEWIDVNVCRTEQSYQSLILAIDPDQKEILIDDLFPKQGRPALEAGDRLEISCRAKRSPINFFTRLLAQETRDGEIAWRLELPEEIGLTQSRGSYRVYVESEVGLEIDIPVDGQTLPAVRVINLSTDGIKLSFPQEVEQQLRASPHFAGCLIRLPTDYYIDCEIELRNLYPLRTPFHHILAGGKMVVANPQQRVKLQQYLASVQRKQRRRENREQ